jgi:hypothetical protein
MTKSWPKKCQKGRIHRRVHNSNEIDVDFNSIDYEQARHVQGALTRQIRNLVGKFGGDPADLIPQETIPQKQLFDPTQQQS